MVKEIVLSKGKVALVDDEDYEILNQDKWFSHSMGYAVRIIQKDYKRTAILMHRQIMGFPAGQVDHKDRNRSNNQRSNLRLCNSSQNNANRPYQGKTVSGYKGVFWHKTRNHWRAMISVNNRMISLGRFDDKVDAAHAYDAAALKHFGEFAWLNFPPESNPSSGGVQN